MGLLLSVLVACVGVVELLAFYSNLRRTFVTVSTQTSLDEISERYLEGLERHRRYLQSQIPIDISDDDSKSDTGKEILLEENEIEPTNALKRSSPKRFPLVEEESDRSRSPSPHLIIANSNRKNEARDFLENYIKEQMSILDQRSVQHVEANSNESVSSSTKQFLVVEQETASFEISEKPRSRSPSPIPRRFGEEQDFTFRRSPSPYPSLVLPVPRNSICNELLDTSVAEVDEEAISRSPTPEKIHVILESKHNSTEYWTNKILVVPPTKTLYYNPLEGSSNSSCSIKCEEKSFQVITERKERSEKLSVESVLSRDSELMTKDENEIEDEIKELDEQFLDSLDGVTKKKPKPSRNSSLRKSRNKRSPITSADHESKDDCLSSSSKQNNDAQTAKTLTEAANLLKHVNQEANGRSEPSAGTSKDDVKKTSEPFWLIFSGEYTKAMNKDWHGQHFCCWQCDESLTGQRYVLRDEHPYCVSCYESVFANACEKCSRIIGIDSKDLSYKDKHWHEACFLCTTCGESLVDRQFGSKGDRIYCGRCYDEQFASRCDGCHEIFRAGTKKMEYKTRQWHEKCFCCCVCKTPIGTQSFIPREQEIYCAKCYEEKFATRCIKCNKVITSGGVTYKNEPWHRECFTCTHCAKSLAGERFTSRDEKPYCAECFGELFAKRCFACNKPITGIGGTKFISFEDRHWHNDCFFCASCRTSLVGRGFITDQDDIICPECAKQKLM